MSAGGLFAGAAGLPQDALVHDSLGLLAPHFRACVEAALAECDEFALGAVVYETYRTEELARLYYARGRTICPPWEPVTQARTNLDSWHGYGLAVDVIHRTLQWSAPLAWFRSVAVVFRRHGCDWGGEWPSFPDFPHFQLTGLKRSPSSRARTLYASGGLAAVWRECSAL